MPIEQLRLLLLVGLGFVAILLWQAWQQDYGVRPPPPPQAPASAGGESGAPPAAAPGAATAPDVPQAAPADAPAGSAAAGPAAAPGVPGAPAGDDAGRLVEVRTDVLSVRIDPRGGTIRRVALPRYPVSLEEPDTPFTLMDRRGGFVHVAESGLVGASAPTHHAEFVSPRRAYRLGPADDRLEVRLHWEDGNGVRVDKVFEFARASYEIGVRYEVGNAGAVPWTGQAYGQFRRTPPNEGGGLFNIYTYTGAVLSSPDKPYEKIDFDDMESEDLERDVQGGWIAMIQHYFAGAWIPPQDAASHYYTKALAGGVYLAGLVGPALTVAPGGAGEVGLKLYAGPKVQQHLEAAAPGLGRTVDYGWLFFIAQPLYVALRFIHDYVGNWGWAIILLTVLIKLAFYHLSAASYRSMARMRKLAPQIQTLRDRHAGDRQKMNQAVMELYRKEKINPLGGCLPIVVQIPVFIALYWVLLETVELRQAGFLFWLKDLASHDPFFVLPLLMGGSMFLQQRLSPTPPDPIQAKVMMFMPVIFTGFFLFFPSGLVLYWFVNNLLSIAQQWMITRRIEAGKQG